MRPTVNIVGVVEDGAPRGGGVPENPRTPITMVAGTDLKVNVSVVGASGERLQMTGGATLTITVKKHANDDEKVFTQVVTNPGPEGSFTVPANAFKRFDPGLYVYDVWLAMGGVRSPVVPLSPFHLEGSVAPVPS